MNVFFSFLLSLAVGTFITLACIYLLKPVAIHIGLVDTPGGRKTHTHAIPLIGGISIFFGFCFSLLCLNISLQPYRGLLAGSAILVLIGVMDDFHELTPRIRLVGQCLSALLLMEFGHHVINHLGDLFFIGDLNLGIFSALFTILFVLGFINATNMIDGHDGLAGLIILGQAIFFIFFSLQLHLIHNVYVLAVFVMMLSLFLLFNLPFSIHKRAKIFMGDAGSTFIGFIIAWFAVDLSQTMFIHKQLYSSFNPVTLLWVLAYPLYDLLTVILLRLYSRRSPFAASRDHFHFILLDGGVKSTSVTYGLFILSIIFGSIGLFLAHQKIPESWQFSCFLAVFIIYFLMTIFIQKKISALLSQLS